MKGKKKFEKILVFGTICILILISLQTAIGYGPDSNEEPILNSADTTEFNNCRVIIFGKCNTIVAPFTWLFGLYCPLLKKDISIQANGEEGERLNVIVWEKGTINIGTWFSQENIEIDLRGTNGILFWAGKSIIVEGNRISAFCVAEQAIIID